MGELTGGRVVGSRSLVLEGVAPIDEATVTDLAFLAARRYLRFVPDTRAGAFLTGPDLESEIAADVPRVVVDEPYAALRTLLAYFHPEPEWDSSVHPTAVIGKGVELGVGILIGPYAVIEDDASIGDGARIGPHCVVGRGSSIGPGTRLHPHVVTYPGTVIGRGVEVHAGARLGADGFGYTLLDGEHAKIPQVGRCVIEDGVEVGANSTIDRGSLGDTRIGEGVKIDNLVHVGHNVRIGARSLLAALVGIAGSTRLGRGVWMGGQSGAINQVELGDGARVVVQSGVTRNVDAGETVSGWPARPHREQLRRDAAAGRIRRLMARLRRAEEDIAILKGD